MKPVFYIDYFLYILNGKYYLNNYLYPIFAINNNCLSKGGDY